MRCTRCDGLAVPQAVGIDPHGKVVFGWCLQCLADRGCKLVETSSAGLWRISSASTEPGPPIARPRRPSIFRPPVELEPTQWVVAIVAALMMAWGMIMLAAGLVTASRQTTESSPLGNGTSVLLATGGASTAVLGAALLLLSSRRNWHPGTFLLGLFYWLAVLTGICLLALGLVEEHPGRRLALMLGAGLAAFVLGLTRMVYRTQLRKSERGIVVAVRQPSRKVGGSHAGGPRP